jgi:hypothetical protein
MRSASSEGPSDKFGTTFYTGSISFGPRAVTTMLPETQSGLQAGRRCIWREARDKRPELQLLPAQYVTLPGAFRVAVNSGVVNPLSNQTRSLDDGTMEMSGYLTNNFTGASPSATAQFMLQSVATWGKIFLIRHHRRQRFLRRGQEPRVPYVPADAGRLAITAVSGLAIDGTVRGTPGAGGFAAQLDISARLAVVDGSSGTLSVPAGRSIAVRQTRSMSLSTARRSLSRIRFPRAMPSSAVGITRQQPFPQKPAPRHIQSPGGAACCRCRRVHPIWSFPGKSARPQTGSVTSRVLQASQKARAARNGG